MRFGLSGIALALALGVDDALAATAPSRLHRYEVTIGENLSHLAVRACFSGALPPHLAAESLDAAGALRNARVEGDRRNLEPNGAELRLPSGLRDTCVTYSVDLSQSAARHEHGGNLNGRVGDDLLIDIGLWLWRPEQLNEGEDLQVSFTLPDGMAVSVPWTRQDEGTNVFRTGRTPHDWPAVMAIGRFRQIDLEVTGARIDLVILGATARIPVDRVAHWIRNAAVGVTTVYGRFPVPHARVIVLPNAPSTDSVPWAFVQRGGFPSAQFLINHRLPDETFLADWTLFHEMAHMLLPYVAAEDAWLSEGMASYYQNVLRARMGVITPLEAWRRLHGGIERGRKSQIGVPLAEATQRMYRNAGFMRVYWHGAALVLLADYRLRMRTQGRHSFDSALSGIAQCCLSQPRQWRARELMEKMDEITGTDIMTTLYDASMQANAIPDLTPVYEDLGLNISDMEMHYSASAARESIRDQIMQPGPAAKAGVDGQ